jgi:hypothetical protein
MRKVWAPTFVVSSHHDAFLAELKPDRDWELRRANSL